MYLQFCISKVKMIFFLMLLWSVDCCSVLCSHMVTFRVSCWMNLSDWIRTYSNGFIYLLISALSKTSKETHILGYCGLVFQHVNVTWHKIDFNKTNLCSMCNTCYLPLQHVDEVICLHAGLVSSQNCEFQTLANVVGGEKERWDSMYRFAYFSESYNCI